MKCIAEVRICETKNGYNGDSWKPLYPAEDMDGLMNMINYSDQLSVSFDEEASDFIMHVRSFSVE